MEVLHNKIPKSHGLHPLEQVTKLWQELNTMLEFVGHKIARMQGFTDVMGQEVHGLVQTVSNATWSNAFYQLNHLAVLGLHAGRCSR